MRKLLPIILLLIIPLGKIPAGSHVHGEEPCRCEQLYQAMNLDGVVDYAAFEKALEGYEKIAKKSCRNIFTLIDFSKPSTEERLYVFDLDRKEVLHVSHVAHGRNSGGNYATSFSNESGSHKSSLGFYLTGGTYQGRNGYSMLLHGLEPGINDKARERAIVVHGAAYANPSVIGPGGRLGRSHGCPALPEAVNREIIDAIKGGTVMFIYANDRTYLAQSELFAPDNIL